MKKLLTLSFVALAAVAQNVSAQDANNPRRDIKTPTIPEQQQSGWPTAYDELQGLKTASVTRGAEGLEISFKDKVLFDSESAAIREGAKGDLDSVAAVIAKNPQGKVRVNGHADATGSAGYNKKLSADRASKVSDYLVAQGVERDSLSQKAYGEKKPVASNKTPEGRQENRRVDIILLN